VRFSPADTELRAWTGCDNAPVALFEDEKPRSGWAEILLLAERLAPQPSLIPARPEERARMFGLAHEICGEEGLGWSGRLASVHSALTGGPGFPEPIARYLGDKYGYTGDNGEAAQRRVIDLLGLFSGLLHGQREAGSEHLLGDSLTAADIYLATFMALFKPLPDELCPMPEAFRTTFEQNDAETSAALDPILFQHRDLIYRQHLELPVEL
jgi:glutathione S-transferase